jgi:hypothetical protein
MSINPYLEVDYLNEARGRYTEQFKDKVVFDKYVDLFLNEFSSLQNEFKKLMQLRTIDEAFGEQLDIIGDIVGQPREIFDVILYNFGFLTADGALSYGDLTNPITGGVFRDINDPESTTRYLNDLEYRTLIKVKIIKNTSNGSVNDVIKCAELLFNEYNVLVQSDGLGYIQLDLNRVWDDPTLAVFKGVSERELARKYLPIPNGVRLGFGTLDPNNGFDAGFNNGFGS